MTIFHKAMLAGAASLVSGEDDPTLGSILLEPSGEVVAVNKWAIMACSPVLPEVRKSLPIINGDVSLSKATALPAIQAATLAKSI